MKTVFSNNSEVAHVWAQRTQYEGRNQNGNIFFYGDKIYSYGYHFLLGKFETNKKGEIAVILNSKSYSSTTCKHQCEVRSATSQYRQFDLMFTDEKSVINELKKLEAKLLRARKPLIYINQANDIIAKYTDYLKFKFSSSRLSKKVLKAYNPFKLSDEELKALQDKDKERIKKEVERKKAAFESDLKKFMNYETDYIYKNPTNEDFVRLSEDGQKIETTKNVSVPVSEAKILYKKILNGEDIKGFKIGCYTVISLNGCLKIGCHNINLTNMHEVCKQL